MIVGFHDQATEDVFNGLNTRSARTIPQKLWSRAGCKLDILDAAQDLTDLRQTPGNHLEKLSGDLAGRWSIRINDQYRIVFSFDAASHSASDVWITDYH